MRNKVVLVYKDIEDDIAEEAVWAEFIGGYYKIDNIPFYAPNLALEDIVSVEDDDGVLYFDCLIESSGHSTLQLIFFEASKAERVLETLEQLGCKWEGMKDKPYFAIDVPPTADYKKIRAFLDSEILKKVLDFKEACVSSKHRSLS